MGKNKKVKEESNEDLSLLVKCCEEVQKAVQVEPPLKWKKKNAEELTIQLGESAHLLVPGDTVSDDVEAQLNSMGLLSKKYAKAIEKRSEKAKDGGDSSEKSSENLEEQIESAETLKQLRTIVKENEQFKDFKTGAFRANASIPEFKAGLLELINPPKEEKSKKDKKKDKKESAKEVKGKKDKKSKEVKQEELEKGKKDKKSKKDKKKDKKNKESEKSTEAKPKLRAMAHVVDDYIAEGGSFEDLCKNAQAEGDKRGQQQKYTKGSFVSHIKFRNTQKPGWLNALGMEITEDGIYPAGAKSEKSGKKDKKDKKNKKDKKKNKK